MRVGAHRGASRAARWRFNRDASRARTLIRFGVNSRRNRDDDAGVAGRESATQSRRATISNRFIGDA